MGAQDQVVGRIRQIAERVAHSHGLQVFDVHYRRESPGWVVRVFLDRPDGSAGSSVSLEDCQRVSQEVGTILDVEDVIDRQYTLEVSSPGLDRPLRSRDDFERFAGRLARIVTTAKVDGQTFFQGRLHGLDGDMILIEGRRAGRFRIPLGLVSKARLEVDF